MSDYICLFFFNVVFAYVKGKLIVNKEKSNIHISFERQKKCGVYFKFAFYCFWAFWFSVNEPDWSTAR